MVLDDVNALGAARRDVLDTLGAEALVDACGVAATFNAIDRVADSTGIPIDEARLEPTADFRESLGINAFPSGKSPASWEGTFLWTCHYFTCQLGASGMVRR